MQIRDLIPWGRKGAEVSRRLGDDDSIGSLQRDINRVFDNFWGRFDRSLGALGMFDRNLGATMPRTDVTETDKSIEVSIELPGMDDKDIDLSLTEDALTVKGEKRIERERTTNGHYLAERAFGSFFRTIPLPVGINTDDAKAEYRKGVLTITLPKSGKAAPANVKKIEVKSA